MRGLGRDADVDEIHLRPPRPSTDGVAASFSFLDWATRTSRSQRRSTALPVRARGRRRDPRGRGSAGRERSSTKEGAVRRGLASLTTLLVLYTRSEVGIGTAPLTARGAGRALWLWLWPWPWLAREGSWPPRCRARATGTGRDGAPARSRSVACGRVGGFDVETCGEL